MYIHKEKLVQSPPIPTLDRKNLDKPIANEVQQFERTTFTLKRSGRVMRKVETAPPITHRDWKPLQNYIVDESVSIDDALDKRKLFAETIYIAKPLIHLASMAYFGTKTWKPYMLSLAMDIIR